MENSPNNSNASVAVPWLGHGSGIGHGGSVLENAKSVRALMPAPTQGRASGGLPGTVNTKRSRWDGKKIARNLQQEWLKDVRWLQHDGWKQPTSPFDVSPPMWEGDPGTSAHDAPSLAASALAVADQWLGAVLSLPGALAAAQEVSSCAVDSPDCARDEPRLGLALFIKSHKSKFMFGVQKFGPTATLAGKIVIIGEEHTNPKLLDDISSLLKATARPGDILWLEIPPDEDLGQIRYCSENKPRGISCRGVDLPSAKDKTDDQEALHTAIGKTVRLIDEKQFDSLLDTYHSNQRRGLPARNIFMKQGADVIDSISAEKLKTMPKSTREKFEAARKDVQKKVQQYVANVRQGAAARDANFIKLLDEELASGIHRDKTIFFVVGGAHLRRFLDRFSATPEVIFMVAQD